MDERQQQEQQEQQEQGQHPIVGATDELAEADLERVAGGIKIRDTVAPAD